MKRRRRKATIFNFMAFVFLSMNYGIPYHKIQGKKRAELPWLQVQL
jgi:hypothetical protein